MPRPKNIFLRKFFEIKGDKQAICKNENCNKILNVHAGNLERHLKKVHPTIFESYIKRKGCGGGDVLNRNFKSETVTKVPATVNRKKNHIQMALIELFTKCGRPLSLAEDRAFQMLVKPTLDAVNIKLDEENILENIASYSNYLKNEISEELCGRLISLKIDAVSRSAVNVLGVNVQFIKDKSVVIKTLAIKQLTETPTGEYLKNLILEVLESYEINLDQVVTITTDNEANMIKADDDDAATDDEICEEDDIICMDTDLSMDNITNVRCGTHTLQLCAFDVIKSTDIKEILDNIRVIVKKLKTQKYVNLLKSGDYKMPPLDNSAIWSSTYLMVESFMLLREFIDSSFKVSNEIWDFAADFINVFEILYTAAKNLQCESLKYSDLYIEITNITIKLDNLPTTDLKLYLSKSLKRRKNKMLENDLFVAAIFLDPRIKVCLTSDQCARAKSCIKQLHNRLLNSKEEEEHDEKSTMEYTETSASPTNSTLSTANSVENALEEYFKSFDQVSHNNTSTTSHHIDQDLLMYESQSRLGIKENIIDFWSMQKNDLAEIAFVVLGIPCTHGSIKRLFSALKYILSDRRNQQSSVNLEHILLVRSNANFIYD